MKKKNIEPLYDRNELYVPKGKEVAEDEKRDSVRRSEFVRVLRDLNWEKVTEIENVSLELLRSLGESVMRKLFFFECKCNLYESSEMLHDFQKSIIIPITKKSWASDCKSHH